MAQMNDTAKSPPRMFQLEELHPQPHGNGAVVHVNLDHVAVVIISDMHAEVVTNLHNYGLFKTTHACGEALIALMNGGG